ncbi:TPA: DnaD domain protein [Clostridium botulinum]|uniref:DnaD domain protein n=1 Tax=Clostridium botulinum TaxID=1491 RepID=UPI0008FCA00A|nr:DnaD domain protein [Clostridium botulinum]APC80684.1 DnaD domain protein [Clostridium botulinum]APU61325.1 DnaD domain protein [Clostridium botulinum]MCS4447130.1 DnaD domain protein [Clostridium botulinum]MCS4457858.1 DnaD domain protein [Clostridium botulinum]MCS4460530.1 DnaD domain protein [Clostridium botulinum]
MAVFRVIKDKQNPYIMVNKYFVYDNRLSLKSKGLMSYFLSRPDDWNFYQSEILKHCRDKRDSISKAINELESAGYIERILRRDSKGKLLGGYDYNIFEIPQFIKDNSEACTKHTESGKAEIGKNRNRENPNSDNPLLLSNDKKLNNDNKVNNKTITNNKNGSSKGNVEVFKHFERCNFGILSPMIMEKIAADIGLYSKEWVMKAAEIADESGKHSYKYIKGILENWKINGGVIENNKVKGGEVDGIKNHHEQNNGGDTKPKGKWSGYKPPKPKLQRDRECKGLI